MEILTVLQATQVLREKYNAELTPNMLMAWIRSGKCPFGVYVRQEGKTKGVFRVFRSRMHVYFNPQTMTEQERSMYITKV